MEENQTKFKTSEEIIQFIKQNTQNSQDMVYKEIDLQGEILHVVYNESVADDKVISDFIIRSIKASYQDMLMREINDNIQNQDKDNMSHKQNEEDLKKEKKKTIKDKIEDKKKENTEIDDNKERVITLFESLEKNIAVGKVKALDLSTDDIFYYLYSGFTCVIYHDSVLAMETKAALDRSVTEPLTEHALKGPKDAFIENYSKNIGLIRKRIKDEKLILEEQKVGRRSQTKVGMLYISDIIRPKLVDYVKNKLSKIDIDAILDSNYILEIIRDSDRADFPTAISTERPDLVCYYLLQGRLALVVENSPFVIVLPAFLNDFVNNIEDMYQKDTTTFFSRMIRYIAFFITILTPAFYVALITFDQESIPTQLLLSFSTQREGVPFPAAIEAFFMIIAFEILREGDFRVPNSGGSTLSIVGALILGDAAVNAGIVSPIMIIVIAITTISGLIFSEINMANALRTWRIIFLLFASLGGLIGISIAILFLIIKLCATTSFTKPFLYPVAPANMHTLVDKFSKRKSFATETKRQKILTDNLTKYRIDKEQP